MNTVTAQKQHYESPRTRMPHRWIIDITATVLTPLSIGDGRDDPTRQPTLSEDEERVTHVNAVARDCMGQAYIPATGLKGALRALSEDDAAELFGMTGDLRTPGCIDVHDLFMGPGPASIAEHGLDQVLANFDSKRGTYLETSTSIDRDRGTVVDRLLFTDELVPPKTRFCGTIFVQATTQTGGEANIRSLLARIDSAKAPVGLALGSDTGRGNGRVEVKVSAIRHFGPAELKAWLRSPDQPWAKFAADCTHSLSTQPCGTINPAPAKHKRIEFELQFTGKYLVNEPARAGKREQGRHAHTPRLDADGNPTLPARTVHGALRSQAEKVLRTMGIATGGAGGIEFDPKKNVGDKLIEELFGSVARASGIRQPHPPKCVDAGSKHVQDFIAIDRFTGGGLDGAKFDAESHYRPRFKISLDVPSNLSDAASGLLLLTLRDLAEGDIPMGWGKRKGYGACTVTADGPEQHSLAQRALRALELPDDAVPLSTLRALAPPVWYRSTVNLTHADKSEVRVTRQHVAVPPDRFHNSYHFVPINTASMPQWVAREHFASDTKAWAPGGALWQHSHAHSRSADGFSRFSGHIRCKLTAESPFVVGAARRLRPDGNGSQNVEAYRVGECLAVPASTLKGLIGSIVEAASGSALRVLDSSYLLTYRYQTAHAMKHVGYLKPDTTGKLVLYSLGALPTYRGPPSATVRRATYDQDPVANEELVRMN